ncbi:sulfur carrier protein ThiS [Dyadobacter helix]|nr:sulfur carrier protein ThiS [Dyadobacter sp. CECT 9275]
MEIKINQTPSVIPDTFTVQQLLTEIFETNHQGIAVAINNQVVSKSQWALHQLQPDDQLIIIRATQGG